MARNTPRSAGIMNAEPMTRMTTDAAIQSAITSFESARPYLGNEPGFSRIARQPLDYRDLLDSLIRDVQYEKANPRLTNKAKWSDIDKLVRRWAPEAEQIVATVEDAAASWERDLKAASAPPAPTSDEMLLEAKLANARTDAAMVLANAKDLEIPERLAEMGRGTDLALRYLVLATPWPATYMRGHGFNNIAAVWDEEKRKVLGSILSDDALKAFEKLRGVPHVQKAASALRMGHSFFRADNPEYFQDDA